MGLFNRHQLSIILKLTVFLNKCIGWAKTNVSLMWRRPVAKEKCERTFSFKSSVNGFHYFGVFVRSWLSLTDLNQGLQTGNKNWLLQSKNWNMKIGIWSSIYLFREHWKAVSNFKFSFSCRLKIEIQKFIFNFLKIENQS